MAISFDKLPGSLPSENKNFHAPKGKYLATLEKAEMRNPNDPTKPPYLSIMWKVQDNTGKVIGNLFDGQYESESPYVQFKLKKFVEALNVNLGPVFELRDLAKVAVGKKCYISIQDDRSDETKSVINIFDDKCYENAETPFDVAPAETTGTAESSY